MAKKEKEVYFTSPKGHPRDRIIINESPNLPKDGIFISLNGFPFLAKAGVEIDLPRPVRKMLDTRLQTETVAVDDGSGKLAHHSRTFPRITYRLIQEDVENSENLGEVEKEKPEEVRASA